MSAPRAVVVIACVVLTSAWTAAQREQLRDHRMVLLNATVCDTAGRFVSNLTSDDFQILVDGDPQQLLLFRPVASPASVSLLVDTSTSMDEEIKQVQQGLRRFVLQLRPGDSAEIVDFDVRTKLLQPMTGNHGLLIAAVNRLRAGGSTSLYNALYISLRQRAAVTPTEPRRRAIVVLSDGEDTSSLITLDALVTAARRGHSTIYAIGLGLTESGERALRQLTVDTGGRLFLARDADELIEIYGQVAAELANQYVLGFVPSNVQPDGGWNPVAVQVRRPNIAVRTRLGFYTAGAPSSRLQ